MPDLDENVQLATGEVITPRQLIDQGRAVLRRSRSYRPAGAIEPREAWMLDIVYLSGPHVPESFEISEKQYADYLAMGLPEIPASSA